MPLTYLNNMKAANPTAYWSFDSLNETTSHGLTSTSISGTAAFYTPTARPFGAGGKTVGHSGTARYTRSYIDVGDTAVDRLHFEAWLYIAATGLTDNVFIMQTSSNISATTFTNSTWLAVDGNRKVYFYSRNSSDNTNIDSMYSNGTIPVQTWTHIAIQLTNNVAASTHTKTIWINGVQDSTKTVGGLARTGRYVHNASFAAQTCYIDEQACWYGDSVTLPTTAEILTRATYPRPKTRVWSSSGNFFYYAGEELFWNGTAWESFTGLDYQYWNGSAWASVVP